MAPGVSQLSTLVCNAAAMRDPKGSSRSSARQAAYGQRSSPLSAASGYAVALGLR